MSPSIKGIIIIFFFFFSFNLESDALGSKEVKKYCRRTTNYKECLRNYNGYFFKEEVYKEPTIKRGPVRIRVIPYN